MSDDFDSIDVLDDEENDNLVRLGKNDLKKLREAAKEGRTARRELDGLKREKAVIDAGLQDLTPKQTAALARLVEDATPENLRAEAVALGWVTEQADPDAVPAAELEVHAEMANAANGATAPASRRLEPAQAVEWPQDKLMRFDRDHPDLYELLMRGQAIDLPAGFQ